MYYSGIEYITSFVVRLQKGSVTGIENLPPPPCVIAANHVSPYDPMLMVAQLYPWMRKYNKKILFLTNPKVIALFGALHNTLGMFPGTKTGLKIALNYLQQGIPVCIFPNRDRKPKQLKKFHLGPAYLAAKANVPIVPIGIKTKEEVYPSWDVGKMIKNFFYKKYFVIGKPFSVKKFSSLFKATEELTHQVANLIDKDVRVN
jgi:1-acyl-sn-glycerol-3-phosphate acyltransferase